MPWRTAPGQSSCRYCGDSGEEVLFSRLVPCRRGCKVPVVPISEKGFWARVRDATQKDDAGFSYVYKDAAAKAFGISVDELAERMRHLVDGDVLDAWQHSYRERP